MGEQKCTHLCLRHVATVAVSMTLPDGSVVNMKVNPHKRIGDLKREVIERSPAFITANGEHLSDDRLALQCLTQATSLHVSSGPCRYVCMTSCLCMCMCNSTVTLYLVRGHRWSDRTNYGWLGCHVYGPPSPQMVRPPDRL